MNRKNNRNILVFCRYHLHGQNIFKNLQINNNDDSVEKKFLTNNAFSNERTHTLQICIKNDATVNKISEPCQAHNETKRHHLKNVV